MQRDTFMKRIQSVLSEAVRAVLDGSVRGGPQPYPPGRQRGYSVLFDHDEYGLIEVYAEDRDENSWHKINPSDPNEVFGEIQTGIEVQRHNDREELPDIPPRPMFSISVDELSGASTQEQENRVFQDALETSLTITVKHFEETIDSKTTVSPKL